jgi:Protein of unknown function (DUF1616)
MKTKPEDDPRILSSRERNLEELVAEIQADGMKREEAAKELYRLWEQGKVRISDPSPPRSFSGYLFGIQGLWFFGILAFLAGISLLIYGIPALEMMVYLRYLLGSVVVLYLPGYVVVEALYLNRRELDELERLVLSVGLSLTLVPLLALFLAYTPWGVSLASVFLLISVFVVTFGLLAAYRSFERMKGAPML